MKITRHGAPEPIPPPPETYTMELTRDEARVLAALAGFNTNVAQTTVDSYANCRSFKSPPTKLEIATVLVAIWQGLPSTELLGYGNK